MENNGIHIHFIDNISGVIVAKKAVYSVPRVGDEIRLNGNAGKGKFFKVTIVIWCYDESQSFHERANVGVEPV